MFFRARFRVNQAKKGAFGGLYALVDCPQDAKSLVMKLQYFAE